ncbi:MAG: hypothetical protein JSV23_05500 [Promethearchaeota archaeon]|nr:MAG: hypothetical protein JSV23_05500 [Candidatus Lokiarchaeota archaeon]
MKQTDDKESPDSSEFKELPPIYKGNLLHSNNLNNIIKSLSNPRFLGSIHLKKGAYTNSNSVSNLIEDELKGKITKSLKNTLFNPITKILIILWVIFNLIWFTLIYIF